MHEEFDAVIVGSGFGGSVMAYRLAEAKMRVCLLERGKVYKPGDFARSPHKMKDNFWDPSEGYYGLFNIWSFDNLEAIVSSGLGGGSLIYANVLLRKPEEWFVKQDRYGGGYEDWVLTRANLDPHYDKVERILKPQKYPLKFQPYDTTSKTLAFKYATEKLNLDWELPDLAVTFGNDINNPKIGEPIDEPENYHGVRRVTCRLCGECDIGCNYGSKNTLDYNYLTLAHKHGADLRPLHEVKAFEPHGNGYRVHYVIHEADKRANGEKFDTATLETHTIDCKFLVLAAGTLGTTYLMLSNRSAFPQVSKQLGTRFCGNGDLLTFALNCSDNSSGTPKPRVIEASYGPVITGMISKLEGRGFLIQDAGYPNFVNWMLQFTDVWGMLKRFIAFGVHRIGQNISGLIDTDVSEEIARLFGKAEFSAGLLPLLGMGRDVPDGKMHLNGYGKLAVDWNKRSSEAFFAALRQQMKEIGTALGSEPFLDNPLWWLSRLITVHPLGGCPMGADDREGVVDSYGRVFNYPGLYIVDGSVMPGPTGVNPAFTIAACADRFADKLLEEFK